MLHVLTYCGSLCGVRSPQKMTGCFSPQLWLLSPTRSYSVCGSLPLKPRPLPALRLCVDRSAVRSRRCADRGSFCPHAPVIRGDDCVGSQRTFTCTDRRVWTRGLVGAVDECSAAPAAFLSCPWLRTCSAAEKSAPSPTLHYDKSRQAGRQAGS